MENKCSFSFSLFRFRFQFIQYGVSTGQVSKQKTELHSFHVAFTIVLEFYSDSFESILTISDSL